MRSSSLVAVDVVKFFGDRKVLDAVHLSAHPGQRLGLVGENGAGKSTLLRLLAGVDVPDAGLINRPAQVGLLHQELPFSEDQSIGDVIADALAESREVLSRLEFLLGVPSRLDEYGEVLQRAEQIEAWDADQRAEEVLHGLGVAELGRDRLLGTLSGGQRSRVALVALLVRRPATLLLDEPTNHLDDRALSFLEGELRRFPGVVVIASHDRVFLDEVCTDIVDLDPARDGVTATAAPTPPTLPRKSPNAPAGNKPSPGSRTR